VIYAPATPYPVRSTDGGLTWTQITNGIGYNYYTGLMGDGNTLYTMHAAGLTGTPYNDPWLCSSEKDGLTWTTYQGGVQKFGNGPYLMKFDKKNRIMYSANWGAGMWALKVIDPGATATVKHSAALNHPASMKSLLRVSKTGVKIQVATGQFYDVNGRTSAKTR
jgi:hypothetical protein